MDMLLDFSNINLSINGKMYGTFTELLGTGQVEKFSTRYSGITYISNVALETITRLNVDYEKMDISILENELLVNRLPLEVTGLIQMPAESIFFDLAIKSKESGFENFLALVPPDTKNLKDIKPAIATVREQCKVGILKRITRFRSENPTCRRKKRCQPAKEIKNIKSEISGQSNRREFWIYFGMDKKCTRRGKKQPG
jgi:predicted enzyme involved in methoxymalonyl-ACP biosynthesis